MHSCRAGLVPSSVMGSAELRGQAEQIMIHLTFVLIVRFTNHIRAPLWRCDPIIWDQTRARVRPLKLKALHVWKTLHMSRRAWQILRYKGTFILNVWRCCRFLTATVTDFPGPKSAYFILVSEVRSAFQLTEMDEINRWVSKSQFLTETVELQPCAQISHPSIHLHPTAPFYCRCGCFWWRQSRQSLTWNRRLTDFTFRSF